MLKISISAIKGGVGKSQTTIGLACALKDKGLKMGIIDSDVTGPKIPAALGMTRALSFA